MAGQRNDDDIAAALHGLSTGHHDSTAEHAGDDNIAPPTPQNRPTPAVPPAQPAARRPAAPPARPAVPSPQPASQVTPPVMTSRASGVSARPGTPVRPAVPGQVSSQLDQEVFDDGDATVLSDLPTAPLDYRGPKAAAKRRAKPSVFKTIGFRQTVIPILLTTGFMMLVMFVGGRFVDPEAPLANLPAWTGIMLLVTGIVLIALAVLNMLAVRADLAKRKAKA